MEKKTKIEFVDNNCYVFGWKIKSYGSGYVLRGVYRTIEEANKAVKN